MWHPFIANNYFEPLVKTHKMIISMTCVFLVLLNPTNEAINQNRQQSDRFHATYECETTRAS